MKNYLVVGGTSGIGLAATTRLLEAGHQVFVWARNAAPIPGAVMIANDVLANLTDAGLPDVLDGVVYCPGSINLKPFHRLTTDDFLHDWQINVLGAVKSLQIVLPRLKAADHASVVLFSSVAAGTGMPFHTSIAASKGAVESLTKSLAAEWAPKIRVNAIAPSLTHTPLTAKLLASDEKIQAASKRHPLQKIGAPDDIAAAVLFLLGEDSRWITGQILPVDGGLSSLKMS